MIGGPEVDSDVPLVSMVPPAHASVFVASASSAPETDVYLREHQRERERESTGNEGDQQIFVSTPGTLIPQCVCSNGAYPSTAELVQVLMLLRDIDIEETGLQPFMHTGVNG